MLLQVLCVDSAEIMRKRVDAIIRPIGRQCHLSGMCRHVPSSLMPCCPPPPADRWNESLGVAKVRACTARAAWAHTWQQS